MKKIENHLKKNRWQTEKSAPKGLLFLVFLLIIQSFSCGRIVGWSDSDETAPTVKFVTPADDSTGVALNASISATFSETMDSTTITVGSFTLFKGKTAVTGDIIYSGETAIFAPKIILTPETEYVATITKEVKDLAGNFLAEDFVWTFTTGETPETVPPQVIATIPFNDSTDVFLNTEIIAVFSEAMEPLTITAANFTLFDGTNPVKGVVKYAGVTATFKPENHLDQNKLYTATINAGVTDLTGNEMEEDFVWTFTTGEAIDDVPPEIISTIPDDGDIDVTLDSTVSAVFSEAMNPLTINSETFTLEDGTTLIEGSVFMIGNTVIFEPENDLMYETEYTATITNMVTDLAGNAMEEDYIWTFTTEKDLALLPPEIISTIPLDEAIDVALDTEISAEFSKEMDDLTITDMTFLVTDDTLATVYGVVAYDPLTKIATFTPDSDLEYDTGYIVTITTDVEDTTGLAMEEDFVWTFTTALEILFPTVISTIPLDEATDVAIDTDISAEFSKEMDILTITDLTFLVTDNMLVPVVGEVTYDELTKIATFNPDNDLEFDTEYTVTITTGVEDSTGVAMEEDYSWTFTTVSETVPPTIIATIPLDKAIKVALDIDISAEFSKEMDILTITDLTFLVTDNMLVPVVGEVTYDELTKIATFNPDNDLEPDTEYTVTITTGVEDLTGVAMEEDYSWTFITDAAPTVISTIPLDEETDVAIDTEISAEFSKEMDDLTITGLTFLVTDNMLVPVDGEATYDELTKIATFNPDNDLELDTEYIVTITIGVKDSTGIAMEEDFVWTFITDAAPTVISTIPLDGATDVALDTKISAEFSEEMNELTITDMTFLVVDDTSASVAGEIEYDELTKTATFTPDSDLLFDTVYTVTITTGVENLTGTAMEEDYIWTFSTGVGAVDLKLVNPFAIASAAGINNTGATHINGDVVLDPNFTCNGVPGVHDGGFGLCDGKAPTINGIVITTQYPDTVTSAAIMADLNAAYQSIMKANLPDAIVLGCGTIGSNGDAGALIGCAGNSTLAPGVYISATDSSIGITGILTLDGQGDNNAEFIFQAPSSTLVTASGAEGAPLSEILLINGAKASNVWWQVGSSATIGAYSVFQGNILADSSITMETGATSCGRLLAGAVTTSGAFIFDSNLVSVPGNDGCPE